VTCPEFAASTSRLPLRAPGPLSETFAVPPIPMLPMPPPCPKPLLVVLEKLLVYEN
jgi:hypothetical protein